LTSPLYHHAFPRRCGTLATADGHTRFLAQVVVYGHLHIPRTTVHDGVRFKEVSLGDPLQRRRRPHHRALPRRILSGARA
jgi:hypothetical protein